MSPAPASIGVPAVDGWFTTEDAPTLVGLRCQECQTLVFPPLGRTCPNPACRGEELTPAELSRTGTVWSYATNHYAPPPPYLATTEPFEPVTVVAVELDENGIVVLGQLDGSPDDIRVGTPMKLTTTTLYTDGDGVDRTVWNWSVA